MELPLKHNFSFSARTSPEEVLTEIERNYSTQNPNINKTQSCWIRKGPQIFKFALFHEIINKSTKEHHHNALTIFSYKKLKEGWIAQEERKIILDDENIDEISILEKFIAEFRSYVAIERKSYGMIKAADYDKYSNLSKSEVGDKINEILEDPENYERIVQQGGLNLMKDVVEWVFKQDNTEAIIEQLDTVDTDTLKELTTIAGISQIKKVLEIWEQNKENNSEEFWQQALKDNSWVLSQAFAAPVILYKEKAYVGGKTLDNKGGNIVDYIFKNKPSGNIILIEIKTPCTKLIGKEYRQTYSMSDEISGAINQTLNYKHQIQQEYIALQISQRNDVFEVLNPRTLLIIGNLKKELSSETGKLEAFELYRENLKDIIILTYDELFAKVENLKSILQNGK